MELFHSDLCNVNLKKKLIGPTSFDVEEADWFN